MSRIRWVEAVAHYSYKAVDGNGDVRAGTREADSVAHLDAALKQAGLELIRARATWGLPNPFARKLTRPQLIALFFSLEQFIRAGVPLLDGLISLRDSTQERHFRDMLSALVTAIENGNRLSQAMEQYPSSFDGILTGLTRAGEESGSLAEAFGRIAEMLQWQNELAAQTRSMMLYPAFTGVAVLGVTLFLLLTLVPQLAGFIRQSGQALPLHTRILLAVSEWLQHGWLMLLIAPALTCIAFLLTLRFSPALRQRLDRLKLSIRPLGPILRKILLARFAYSFSMMYGAGIGIPDCLASARNLSRNTAVVAAIQTTMRGIASGRNLTQSLQDSGLFPLTALRIINVGETTGRLETALQTVGSFYDREAKEAVKQLQGMTEPVMTVLLGAVLGWVMLSVLGPIYDMIGGAGLW